MKIHPKHGSIALDAQKRSAAAGVDVLQMVAAKHEGLPYTFSILDMKPLGRVDPQTHPEEHAVLVIQGSCRVLLGAEWVVLEKDGYAHIPPQVPHAFEAQEPAGAKIVILKLG